MEVTFFMPGQYMPDAARQEAWKSGRDFALLEGGKAACAQCWIFQTWQRLKARGFPARIESRMPSHGVVVALAGSLAARFRKPREVTLLGVVADGSPHHAADLHILQNAQHARSLPRAVFMPLWTQPHLLPRNPERGARFSEVAFFGDLPNLAPELSDPRFAARLEDELGIRFRHMPAQCWHDYRETDAAIGIRSFARKRFLHKPATKLTNAWLAGVPYIGGPESASSAIGRPGTDCLVCSNLDETLAALRRLLEDPAFRKALVEAGAEASKAFTFEAIEDRWLRLLGETVPRLAAQPPAGFVARSGRRLRLALDRLLAD